MNLDMHKYFLYPTIYTDENQLKGRNERKKTTVQVFKIKYGKHKKRKPLAFMWITL